MLLSEDAKDIIYIRMFGNLELKYGAQTLGYGKIRSEQMTKLLAFLLYNHKRTLSVQEIIDNIWGDDVEIDNPIGALKNLIYRLRNLLRKELGCRDYILSGRGTYSWNDKIDILIDYEVFDINYSMQKKVCATQEDKFICLNKLLEVYTGEFLDIISTEHWVVPMNTYYRSAYIDSAKKLARLCKKMENYALMESVAALAIAKEPYDEEIYCYQIWALLNQGKNEMAKEYCENAERFLRNALGLAKIDKFDSIKEHIYKVCNGEESIECMVKDFDNIVLSDEELENTFFCEANIFKEIYRLDIHRNMRNDIPECIALFTICFESSLDVHETKVYMENMIEKLKKAICNSLRVSDVAAQMSNTQIAVLLPNCDTESVRDVIRRVRKNFTLLKKSARVELKYEYDILKNITRISESEDGLKLCL